jgi:NCAIR mutase (PurE)-related protein
LRPAELRRLLDRVRRGEVKPAAAARTIAAAPLAQLEFATLDHQRALRAGFPEVVFGQGKRPDDLVAIMGRLYERSGVVLATRVDDAGRAIARAHPRAEVFERARAVVLARRRPRGRGRVVAVRGHGRPAGGRGGAVTARTLGAAPNSSRTSGSRDCIGCSLIASVSAAPAC